MKKRSKDQTDIAVTAFALIVVTIVILITVRLQRGLLGLLLGGLAVSLTIYWLHYIFRAVRMKRLLGMKAKSEPWKPDIIDLGDELLVVGKIQIPKEEINVQVHDRALHVQSGSGVRARITLPIQAETSNVSYRNGVLEIRLKKTALQSNRSTNLET